MTTTEENWDWAHAEAEPTPVDLSSQRVTAVLVAHNGAAWLPQALDSLGELDFHPDRLIAVDTGSTDETAALLTDSGLCDEVITGADSDGFGDAVRRALTLPAGPATRALRAIVPGEGPAEVEWLWLLHDDIVVAPDALEKLLEAAVTHEADVVGPMLLEPEPGVRRIAELGVSINDSADRITGLERGEIDQGQHHSTRVLGVNTCGMLVRRRVFDELGGLAPELPLFRDGVDFGWRATAAGHRVLTVPEAAMWHRSAGHHGERDSALIGDDPIALDRALGLRTVAARGGSASLIAGTYARAAGFLLAKAPGRARSELAALKLWRQGPATLAERVPPATDPAAIAELRPGRGADLAAAADAVHAWGSRRWAETFGDEADTSLDELTGDEFAAAALHRGRWWTRPAVLVAFALLLGGLVAGRRLFGLGHIVGPQLLPAPDTTARMWRAYVAPIAGAPGLSTPPWEGLIAAASLLTFGRPGWLIGLLVWGGVALAYTTSQALLRRCVTDRASRLLGGVAYALLVPLLGAVNRGSLGLWLVAIVLPLLAVGLRTVALRSPQAPERWRAAFWSGLLFTIIIAFHPILGGVGLVAALIAAMRWHADPVRLGRVAIIIVMPVVLLLPWWPAVLRGLSRLLIGPDAGVSPVTTAGGTPAMVGWALLGVLVVLALIAAARRTSTAVVWVGWTVALVCGAAIVGLSGTLATALPFGTKVRPDTTALAFLGLSGLVLAAATGLAGLERRVLRLPLVGVSVVSVLAAATWWLYAGATGPLQRSTLTELPPFVRVSMASPQATRTLALDFHDGVRWSLIADDGLRLGDGDRGLAFGGSKDMQDRTRSVVARMTSGTGDERVAADLTSLGVAHVWVTGASEEQRTKITNIPGLGAGSGDERGLVWTVPATAGRLTVTGPASGDQPATPVIVDGRPGQDAAVDLPAGAGRTLTIADPADGRRSVTYAGQPLTGRSVGPAQVYALPEGAGRLEVSWSDPIRTGLVTCQILALLGVLLAAAPSWSGEQRRRAARRAEGDLR